MLTRARTRYSPPERGLNASRKLAFKIAPTASSTLAATIAMQTFPYRHRWRDVGGPCFHICASNCENCVPAARHMSRFGSGTSDQRKAYQSDQRGQAMANDKCVAYYRVSTQRQGRSGLGLEAQRDAVEALVARRGGRLLEEITEVESGKRSDRPELRRAICRAKVSGARLTIAKLESAVAQRIVPAAPPRRWRPVAGRCRRLADHTGSAGEPRVHDHIADKLGPAGEPPGRELDAELVTRLERALLLQLVQGHYLGQRPRQQVLRPHLATPWRSGVVEGIGLSVTCVRIRQAGAAARDRERVARRRISGSYLNPHASLVVATNDRRLPCWKQPLVQFPVKV